MEVTSGFTIKQDIIHTMKCRREYTEWSNHVLIKSMLRIVRVDS